MKTTVEVRFALYVVRNGRRTLAGARLILPPEVHFVPRSLKDTEDNLTFDFSDAEAANKAAKDLQKYIEVTANKEGKQK